MKAFVFLFFGLILMSNGVFDPYLVGAGIGSIALAGYLAGG